LGGRVVFERKLAEAEEQTVEMESVPSGEQIGLFEVAIRDRRDRVESLHFEHFGSARLAVAEIVKPDPGATTYRVRFWGDEGEQIVDVEAEREDALLVLLEEINKRLRGGEGSRERPRAVGHRRATYTVALYLAEEVAA